MDFGVSSRDGLSKLGRGASIGLTALYEFIDGLRYVASLLVLISSCSLLFEVHEIEDADADADEDDGVDEDEDKTIPVMNSLSVLISIYIVTYVRCPPTRQNLYYVERFENS